MHTRKLVSLLEKALLSIAHRFVIHLKVLAIASKNCINSAARARFNPRQKYGGAQGGRYPARMSLAGSGRKARTA
jgi:hypothetical protein